MKYLPYILSIVLWSVAAMAVAQSDAELAQEADLAQELANPLANIVSVPFQLNFDDNLGPAGDGTRTVLNFQPVLPFGLDNSATIVTRTIIPYIWLDDVVPGTSQEGFGDILFSAWYTPAPRNGVTWGIGPAVQIPTNTDVSSDTWAAGLTAIALKQAGPWTYGGLANHLWDFESNPTTEISKTFVQPFVAYSTPSAWTFSVTSESTYDWKASDWSVPVNFSVSKLEPIGRVPVNWQAGVGYWVESPENGPEDWRFRLQAQFVLPR